MVLETPGAVNAECRFETCDAVNIRVLKTPGAVNTRCYKHRGAGLKPVETTLFFCREACVFVKQPTIDSK